ncbi:MAG: biotin/lipoyl-binding protein, partial [Gammaproteobacteria bacterium]|nr:biotin/lipoyl-binding protein [Gammaproteobacteria bacterium]
EVRLYAEDPRHQYTPQTGTILSWQPAHGEGIRIDAGIAEGSVVSPWYDPMLAKLIAYGRTRDEARRRLIRCLEDSVLFGVTDNRHYLARILAHPAFAAGQATTAFLQAHFASDTSVQPLRATPLELALAAILLAPQDSAEHGWRTHLPVFTPLRLAVLGGEPGDIALRLCQTGRTWQVSLDAHDTQEISVRRRDHQELVFTVQGVCQKCQYRRAGDTLYLQHRGRTLAVEDRTHQGREASAGSGSGRVLASMDGAIVALNVQEGDTVSAGQTLVVLEAMKMEHPLKADLAGTVRTCTVSVGDQVKRRQLLIHIDAGETHP